MKKTFSWQNFTFWVFAIGMLTIGAQILSGCGENQAKAVEEGRALYVSYCQVCHGEHGDGAMSDRLSSPPPDLRQISARRNGEFPEEYIAGVIAGRERITGHPASDMPSFWIAIRNGENLSSDEQVEEKIDLLVAYLKSIQNK